MRIPAARKFISDRGLNESLPGDLTNLGIIIQGGLYNNLLRALEQFGLANAFGESRIPIFVLNAVYPLVPSEITGFCATKTAVLVVEEGQPEFIEQEVATILRRADM